MFNYAVTANLVITYTSPGAGGSYRSLPAFMVMACSEENAVTIAKAIITPLAAFIDNAVVIPYITAVAV